MTKITAELTKPLLIDGAMSTALEQLGADTNNSLWTASVLANQPALVKKVHQEYGTVPCQVYTLNNKN
ncbi:homocysteine S-methyltransferase family protein [Limosilactobacillus reuteri]|uniref:homocysteine S-methyltransferase family protein n=1 Tax=Limosilactobacillus reuteri TaxID=1598 RepID=UPI001CDAD914|nr:homocysteine S-methyltransferase family protein [Limosilactobacillus reuteri]